MARIVDLARAAHAVPTLVVTAAAALMTRGFGGEATDVLAVGAAVLTGQLSIGWSNDAIDADRDRQVGRADKPAASGALSVSALRTAAVAAVTATIVASLLLGLVPGVVHLLAVVSMGWAYNLGLKSTVASALPYAIAFGTLPSVASLPVLGQWAPLWLGVAGAAIGVAAHLANALPDLADDARTGVRGLPHRIGERGCRRTAAVVLALAVVVVLGESGMAPVIVALVLAAAAGCLALLLIGRSSRALPSIMALTVLVIVVAGGRITG